MRRVVKRSQLPVIAAVAAVAVGFCSAAAVGAAPPSPRNERPGARPRAVEPKPSVRMIQAVGTLGALGTDPLGVPGDSEIDFRLAFDERAASTASLRRALGSLGGAGFPGASATTSLGWSLLAGVAVSDPTATSDPSTPGVSAPAAGAIPADGGSSTSTEALARAAQNPVADLISLPIQYNANFGFGPDDGVQSVVNVQPVIPFKVTKEWNVITRTIVPIVYQPPVTRGGSDEFGLGDITFTAFLSPSKSDGFVWGVGPAFLIPTATSSLLGQGKFGIGPSVVGLYSKGPWVVGALFNNIWSVAGSDGREDVNQMTLQPFLNYNFGGGWYLTSAPILLANWEAESDDRWTVPVGGGVGRVMHFGKQPVNISLQGYWNVERPDVVGEWTLRFQVQLLFPT